MIAQKKVVSFTQQLRIQSIQSSKFFRVTPLSKNPDLMASQTKFQETSNHIQRRTSLVNTRMGRQHVKVWYLELNLLQDILLCFVNRLLSFPKSILRILFGLLNPNQYYEYAHEPLSANVYPSLEAADASHLNIRCLKQDPNNRHNPTSTHSSRISIMTTICYASLSLSFPLHEPPKNYDQRLPQYDGAGNITARKHVDEIIDFIDLEGVDHEHVKLRLFAQSLSGKARKWYRSLTTRSIPNFQHIQSSFLNRWEVKKNPFPIMVEYWNLKRQPD